MSSDLASRQRTSSSDRASSAGTEVAAPGKQTLVEQAFGAAQPRASGEQKATAHRVAPSEGKQPGDMQPLIDDDDLASTQRDAPHDEDLGGSVAGEALGDAEAPVGTAADHAAGRAASAATSVSISSVTTSAAKWSPHGLFHWEVAFSTSGRKGWLIQEVRSARTVHVSSGARLPDTITPRYWEAWEVHVGGGITPVFGRTHDTWHRHGWRKGTRGHWSIAGAVYFTKTNPAMMGFTPGGVRIAGGLLSTTSAPSGLGVARLHRYAEGTWDSTTATPTHTGTAGP